MAKENSCEAEGCNSERAESTNAERYRTTNPGGQSGLHSDGWGEIITTLVPPKGSKVPGW